MTECYSSVPRFHHAVDCIIFGFSEGKLSLLLKKRQLEPCIGQWSLMGGFVQEDESVNAATQRVLYTLTGLRNIYMRQVGTFGAVHRDPGGRVISTAYYALINVDEYDKSLVEQHHAHWVSIDELPPLVFDHPEMIDKAIKLMRIHSMAEPIGFNLLPELFTLSQLQSLYEAINGCPIDKRNFRKRILESSFVEKTAFIDKEHSRRGASLYRFNKDGYLSDARHKP